MNASELNSQADEKVCTFIVTTRLSNRETTHLVTGVLKGYDQLLNLVLDDVTEELQCALSQGFNKPKVADYFRQCQNPIHDPWV